jgi:glycine cleavage system H protein
MSRPDGYKFLKSHEWARIDGEFAWIGITDYAVKHLSDLVFLDLPDLGQDIMANEPFGEIESVKTVSDLYAPLTGEVVERNEEVAENLDVLKNDPWNAGWMLRIRMEKPSEFESLLDARGYDAAIAESEG